QCRAQFYSPQIAQIFTDFSFLHNLWKSVESVVGFSARSAMPSAVLFTTDCSDFHRFQFF
ncbi:hypothetical protein, partial [Runella sp.]|uniref:hypothetical protein n=1 Tax=Runella sp. TaxID=1960881 RepID=UPI00301654C1